ncbi:MAG: hypothetical protein EPN86_02040 [Nanoarchaeota archaeon]|nr:MAG: hypothetical protein EPN86_02040 [Nanoarchaeota archaeon]
MEPKDTTYLGLYKILQDAASVYKKRKNTRLEVVRTDYRPTSVTAVQPEPEFGLLEHKVLRITLPIGGISVGLTTARQLLTVSQYNLTGLYDPDQSLMVATFHGGRYSRSVDAMLRDFAESSGIQYESRRGLSTQPQMKFELKSLLGTSTYRH